MTADLLLGLSVSCAWLLLSITSTVGFSSVIGDEVAQALGIAPQPVRDQPMDCSFRVLPVSATLTRWASSEDLDALVDGAYRIDAVLELLGCNLDPRSGSSVDQRLGLLPLTLLVALS